MSMKQSKLNARILHNSLLNVFFVMAFFLVCFTVSAEEEPLVPVIKNLQEFAKAAKKRNVPILILFSMDYCEYCEIVRDDYLQPRHSFENNILIGEVLNESYNYIHDFDGDLVSAEDIGDRYSADFSPTLVFVDSKGNRLIKHLTGFNGHDFYDHRLDAAIQRSIKKLTQ